MQRVTPHRHFLITGASSGIGAAVAARLAGPGAHMTLLGRSATKLKRLATSLAASAAVHTVAVDFGHAGRLTRSIDIAMRRIDRLDAVVHAAGVLVTGRSSSYDARKLDDMMKVNVHAAMTITRALIPLLKASSGTLVFINSSGVLRAQPSAAEYIASKHALRGLTDTLREELNAHGVRVTSVFPGRTATPMQRAVHAYEGRNYHPEALIQPADIAEVVACAIDLPRTCEVVDVVLRPMQPPTRK